MSEVLTQVPLAPYTSWQVGGVADQLYRVTTQSALSQFLASLPVDEPLLWMGRGSNLLIRDGGFRGTVILLAEGLDQMSSEEAEVLSAEAGVSLARLSRQARGMGCHDLDFLAGIPGSVGGALAMNAGAFGGEIWDHVRSVETIDHQGEVRREQLEDFDVGYRSVQPQEVVPERWFIGARFRCPPSEPSVPLQQQLKQRNQTQPMGTYSCGSVFRNPEGDHAGRLIEAAGLKGLQQGGASVSTQHANFIVHQGAATATDIETLIETVQQQVLSQSGIALQPEVKIVGEAVRQEQRA